MIRFLLLFLLLAAELSAATYYVAKTGSDGNAGTLAAPWLTLGKAATVTAAGDTVMINDGDWDEHVYETTSGSSGNPITYRAVNRLGASVRAFRLGGSYITLDGLDLTKFSGVGNTWGAAVRIEPTSDYPVITNCRIRDLPYALAHDFSFGFQTINSPSSDFVTAGFKVGSKIYLGASGADLPIAGPQYYANHDTTWEVATVSKTQLTLTNGSAAWVTDSGSNYWAFIRSGSGNSGFYAILAVESGPESPQNGTITNNEITNWASHAMNIDGDGFLIRNNKFNQLQSFRAWSWSGSDHIFQLNLVHDCPNVIHYTETEIDNLDHPPGTGFYDNQVAMFSGFTDSGNHQNVLIEQNWFQNLENQMGRVDDQQAGAFGITYNRNVFVGVSEHFSGGRDGMKWTNNTFYRCTWGSAGHPLSIGGQPPAQTGYEITGNLFVACGAHGLTETATRGWYSISDNATSPIANLNFVASEEVTGYAPKSSFSEAGGINGGDPVFYNANDPLGPDGQPFTADDGLQVLANSPAAALGGGALGVRPVFTGQPVAHFRVASPTGWFEPTGDDYDLTWLAELPTKRGRPMRPYTTPVKLGEVPVTVTFAADKSISGVGGASTNTAITRYSWDFGDGTPIENTPLPTITHTYVLPGDWTVKLTVQNSLSNSHSISNSYRIGGLPPGSGEIREVPAEYSTVQAALNVAAPGDTVRISAGSYPETINTASNGTSADRITIEGQGEVILRGWNQRHAYHVIRNLKIQGTTGQYQQQFEFERGAHFNILQDCIIDSLNAREVSGISWQGGQTNEASDNVIERCTIRNVWGYPMVSMSGNRNVMRHCIIKDGLDVDFLRLFGTFNTVQDNIFENNLAAAVNIGNHPDFVQTFGNNGEQSYGHIIERNIVRNAPVAQLSQLSTTGQPNIRDWTFRNNIFMNIGLSGSCTTPGVQYYNNVFYRCSYLAEGQVLNFGTRKHDRFDVHKLHPEYPYLLDPLTSGELVMGAYYNVELPEVEAGTNAIVPGKQYKARTRGLARILYNGIERINNEIFEGVSGQTDFSILYDDNASLHIYGFVTYKGVDYERDKAFQASDGVTTFTASSADVKLYRNIISYAHEAKIFNNVFIDCGEVGNNTNGWYSVGIELTGAAADYNYVSKGSFNPVRAMLPSVPVGGPGRWDRKGWFEPNGINGGDPGLVAPASYDFRLLPGSILIDKGQNIAGVTTDYAKLSRPRGLRTDIGAYEKDDNVTPPPPPVEPEPLLAPSALTGTQISTSSTRLTWTRNSNNETHFELSKSLNGSAWDTPVNVPAGSTSYQITGLAPSTTYHFRLRAANATGFSSFISTTVTTAATPAPLRRRSARSNATGLVSP